MPHSSPAPLARRARARSGRALAFAVGLSLLGVLAPACETFDSPPLVFVNDLVDGNLPDAAQPIVLTFSEPVDAATLRLKLVLLETDDEGNLFDEDESKETELETFFVREPGKDDVGGAGELSKDRLSYTITLEEPLPVGPSLALLVEEGLADDQGVAWQARQRIPFGYRFSCQEGATSQVFQPGAYFFVVNANQPIPTQLQLWVWFDVDPVTGIVTGQFTNADRKTGDLCSASCPGPDDEGVERACRTVPVEECVAPSFKAASEDEYVDFVPNLEPPEGYTFRANACVADQPDGSVSFGNAPVDVAIEQPPVSVLGTRLTAQFILGDDGVLRCNGSFTGDQVLLGTSPSGPASGSFVGRAVPADEVPADIPKPQ